MTNPCILCVAITGSVPTKADNPAVPITVSEQIESSHEAFEIGASIAHCHVRDDDGNPTSDPVRFAALKAGIEAHCPGMIIQFSTGGRSGSGRDRGACFRWNLIWPRFLSGPTISQSGYMKTAPTLLIGWQAK
jgi:3-keto-5-aminohexanoate cleavage enzyme